MSAPYTREQIEKMSAGQEMDALVAEHVMGWRWYTNRPHGSAVYLGPPTLPNGWPPAYPATDGSRFTDWPRYLLGFSRDIAAAWTVVEKVTKTLDAAKDGDWWLDRLGFHCCDENDDSVHGQYRCHLTTDRAGERVSVFAQAETAPLAICRAALLLVLA